MTREEKRNELHPMKLQPSTWEVMGGVQQVTGWLHYIYAGIPLTTAKTFTLCVVSALIKPTHQLVSSPDPQLGGSGNETTHQYNHFVIFIIFDTVTVCVCTS